MEKIFLKDIFNKVFSNQTQYKLHFARPDETQPLDAYMRSGIDKNGEWERWNKYSKAKGKNNKADNDFNREYIFSLISFYPEKDTWLFGGIWRVTGRNFLPGKNHPYDVEVCEDYNEFIGRLKITYEYKDRETRPLMEKHFSKFEVKEILPEAYNVVSFPGYREVDYPFKTIEIIIKKDNPAWKTALSVKGIYLICDTRSGKKYVGKASGVDGIWGRWKTYIENGHGGDVDLIKLVNDKTFTYVKDNFKFTILECFGRWEETEIDKRESYWKRALLSRLETVGHNKN